jgi:hypothetical protein
MLARENEIQFERDGMKITAHVADEVQLKIELERRGTAQDRARDRVRRARAGDRAEVVNG